MREARAACTTQRSFCTFRKRTPSSVIERSRLSREMSLSKSRILYRIQSLKSLFLFLGCHSFSSLVLLVSLAFCKLSCKFFASKNGGPESVDAPLIRPVITIQPLDLAGVMTTFCTPRTHESCARIVSLPHSRGPPAHKKGRVDWSQPVDTSSFARHFTLNRLQPNSLSDSSTTTTFWLQEPGR